MSTVAVGMYLRTIREHRGLSRSALAEAVGTNDVQILRIERGEIDTRSSLLLAIVRAIQGSLEQVGQLILEEGATEQRGEELATAWLSRPQRQEIEAFIENIPDEQVADAIALIEQLQSDPEALAQLIGYAERMIEERKDRTKTTPAADSRRRRR